MKCIVLDAMGVIFRAADDVADLLIPFVREAGGNMNANEIESVYLDASLGIIEADDFWNRVGLAPSVEDDYLSRHSLVPGVAEFLRNAKHQKIPVWCLSNDIDRWSRKLRAAFDIEGLLAGVVISSAVSVRKPDRRIYQFLLDQSGYRAEDLLFVDDRAKNVEAAAAIGIRSLRFSLDVGYGRLTEQLLGAPSKKEERKQRKARERGAKEKAEREPVRSQTAPLTPPMAAREPTPPRMGKPTIWLAAAGVFLLLAGGMWYAWNQHQKRVEAEALRQEAEQQSSEAQAKQRALEETQRQAKIESQRKLELEAKRKAEAQRQAELEAKRKADTVAKRKAKPEAKRKAELGAKQKAALARQPSTVSHADLGTAQLQGADLRSANLQQTDLRSAQLQGANLSFAQLQEADLSFAQLQEADLIFAQLQGADLSFANLQGAILTEAQLRETNLGGANLQGAILIQVKAVTASQIKRATNWRLAFYSDDFLAELNLPADHNETVKKKLAEIEKEKTIMP